MEGLANLVGNRLGEISHQAASPINRSTLASIPGERSTSPGSSFKELSKIFTRLRGQKLVEALSDDAERLARLCLDMGALAAD